ncbi:polysaccharide pyruvyl transferase family protein [Rheinheimera sp. 1928-s]|uniref:polysaccharide pyruvyl transferase family protein n=1 Tax=Rheinheimera sp. 1928-s TaxID=3033803 RepID=UPI00260CD6A2|nr:polysaccharide pyruvyl transferase family protein [Rheinheimera sp. 1928-s]MDF3125699.1 polysaccharide pyruvyl transferase family protein [Rheinheimera sp. 1928-s]
MIVLHSYSTKNSGDGLLVELTKEVGVETNLGPISKLVALDKKSFSGFDSIYEPMIVNSGLLGKINYAFKSLLNVFIKIDLFERYLPDNPKEIILAVGGGYMRGRTLIESLKTFLAHGPQLIWASRQKTAPVIYLPQSIGPFKGPMRALIHNKMKCLDVIFARDDLTVKELNLDNVIRVPDLAVQELAMSYKATNIENKFDKIYLIARAVSVHGEEDYIKKLLELKNSIPGLEPLIQSEGRGNNDVSFYKKLGWHGSLRKVKDVLDNPENRGVVISVRLHGSLQSMISGCPSIHLSYERKGFGAFSDLGITEYCHGFKRFDPNLVKKQADDLKADSSEYWKKISLSVDSILEKRELMLSIIRRVKRGYEE